MSHPLNPVPAIHYCLIIPGLHFVTLSHLTLSIVNPVRFSSTGAPFLTPSMTRFY